MRVVSKRPSNRAWRLQALSILSVFFSLEGKAPLV